MKEKSRYFECATQERDVQNFMEWVFYQGKDEKNGQHNEAKKFLKACFNADVFKINNIIREKKLDEGCIPDFVVEFESSQREKAVLCLEIKNGKRAKFNNPWQQYRQAIEKQYEGWKHLYFFAAFPLWEKKKHDLFEPFCFKKAKIFLGEWAESDSFVKDFYESKCFIKDEKEIFLANVQNDFNKISFKPFEFDRVDEKEIFFKCLDYKLIITMGNYACVGYKLRVEGSKPLPPFKSDIFKKYSKGKTVAVTKQKDKKIKISNYDDLVSNISSIIEELSRILALSNEKTQV